MKLYPILALLLLTACTERPQLTYPRRDDVEALVVPRPKVPPEALIDPGADARYRSKVRRWEDDLAAAGGRVCRFLRDTGMKVECGG